MGTSPLLAFGEMKVDEGRVANHSFFPAGKWDLWAQEP